MTSLFLAFCAALLFLPSAFLFLFPGAFLVFSRNRLLFDADDPARSLGNALAVSLAYWSLSYWATLVFPVRLTTWFIASVAAMVPAFLYLLKSRSVPPPRLDWKEQAAVGSLLAAAVAARFVPFFTRITGSVGDMVQHNYMARIVLAWDGFNRTYEPVLPFSGFGEYPLAFHTLSALLAAFSALPLYRATQFMSCAAHVLICLGLYSALSRRFSQTIAMAASCAALFLSHYPQFLNQWGSSPTALSTGFLFFAYAWLADERAEPLGLGEQAAAGLVLACGLLSHLVPPIGFAIYLALHIGLRRLRRPGAFRGFLLRNWAAFLFAALFLAPFLANFNFGVFQESRPNLVHGHEQSLARIFDVLPPGWPRPVREAAGGALALSFILGPAFFLFCLAAALAAAHRFRGTEDGWTGAEFLAFLAGAWALVLLFRLRAFPWYHLLQTERIHYFLLVPGAALAAIWLRAAARSAGAKAKAGWAAAVLAAGIFGAAESRARGFESHYSAFRRDRGALRLLLRDLAFGSYFAYAFDAVNSGVTDADLAAFRWIRARAPLDAVFLTNPGDGGPLISSIAERRIWDPHGMDLWHARELEAWHGRARPTHVYVGRNNSRAYERRFRAEDLDREPEKYALLYDEGGCRVYAVRAAGEARKN